MTHRLLAALVAFTLAGAVTLHGGGCGSDAIREPLTTLEVRVAFLNLAHAEWVVADVAVGPKGAAPDALASARVPWELDDEDAVVAFPCDPALNPYEVHVTPVGPYATLPDVLGGVGDPAPEGVVAFQNPGTLTQSATCIADEATLVHFDVALMRPARQGFVDFALNGGHDGDLVADLWFDVSVPDPSERVTSAQYGDGEGSFSYTAPCDVHDPGEASGPIMTMTLIGLYAAEVTAPGDFGDPAPAGGIEHWEIGRLPQFATCLENQDLFLQFDVVPARVERDDDIVRARFDGVACGAFWRCIDDDPASAELELTCEAEGAAPTLHVDALTLRCDGADDVTYASSATPIFEAVDETRWATTVRMGLPEDAALDASCRLTGRATAAPSDDRDPWRGFDGEVLPAQRVYPVLTWDLVVGDDDGFRCQRARLGHGGPISVAYTPSDNDAPTRFDQVFAPAGPP